MKNAISTSPARRLRRLALVGALGVATLAAIPASGQAAKFGAKLNGNVQPSNSLPAHECEPNAMLSCSWIQNDAYGNAGGHEAPKDGTIDKIRVITGAEQKFRFQLAKVNGAQEAKAKYTSSVLEAEGQDPQWNDPYEVDTFNVNVPVQKGQQLGIKSKKTSMVRCSSGGDNTLIYQPALTVGNPFASLDEDDGCWLLIQATYE